MINLNLKAGPIGLVLSGLILTVTLPYLVGTGPLSITRESSKIVTFDKEVREVNIKQTISAIETVRGHANPEDRFLIKLTSPGGEVFSGKRLITEMKGKLPIDTYVSSFAASMAADIWVAGDRRYVDPDALILFHGAHSGSVESSQPILQKKMDILESQGFLEYIKEAKDSGGMDGLEALFGSAKGKDKAPKNPFSESESSVSEAAPTTTIPFVFDMPNTAIAPKAEPKAEDKVDPKELALFKSLAKLVKTEGYDVVHAELQTTLELIKTINLTSVGSFDEVIKQSNGKLTRESIIKDVFQNFSKDMIFTGQQLFDMGIATDLGAPNEEDYK